MIDANPPTTNLTVLRSDDSTLPRYLQSHQFEISFDMLREIFYPILRISKSSNLFIVVDAEAAHDLPLVFLTTALRCRFALRNEHRREVVLVSLTDDRYLLALSFVIDLATFALFRRRHRGQLLPFDFLCCLHRELGWKTKVFHFTFQFIRSSLENRCPGSVRR